MKKKRRFQSFRTLLLRFHRYPCFTQLGPTEAMAGRDGAAAAVLVVEETPVAPAASGAVCVCMADEEK